MQPMVQDHCDMELGRTTGQKGHTVQTNAIPPKVIKSYALEHIQIGLCLAFLAQRKKELAYLRESSEHSKKLGLSQEFPRQSRGESMLTPCSAQLP
jgi:hypothetical protein